MANPEHLEILDQGVDVWNRWREENPDVVPELNEADLQGMKLNGANLRMANLNSTNLGSADLRQADLSMASLIVANLIGANLIEANLGRANLSGAVLIDAHIIEADLMEAQLIESELSGTDLTSTRLRYANLNHSNLNGTIFKRASIGNTVFGDVDLSNTRGLEYVYHIGPFTVGIDTMIASGGAIPKSFLRGCGVPENFIQYMSSLTVKAFEYYSCFISYSSKDQDFADRLYADLQNKGVRCWFAQEDIKGGKKIPQFKSDGIIRIRRETKNRQGKTVTTVFGFDLDDQALKIVAKDLKQPGGAFFKL